MTETKLYLVSALANDSNPAGQLKRHATRDDAIKSAKGIIDTRRTNGHSQIGFYILEVSSYVGPVVPKIMVKTLRSPSRAKKK